MNHNEGRVALIQPYPKLRIPNAAEPLTLLTLGATLQHEGFDVSILDGSITTITPSVLAPFDIVAVTAKTAQYSEAKRILEMSRSDQNHPQYALVGGPHVTVYRDNILKDGWDGACAGEGDLEIAEMIRKKTKGLVLGQPVKELDSLPFPARNLIKPENYVRENDTEPSISVQGMRGCPFVCIYCARDIVGKNVRFHSPIYIVNQIKEVIKKYNIKKVVFYDDTFTLKKTRAIELSNRLGELGISWICNTRVDQVDIEVLEAMKKGGCTEVSFGVEAANNRVLDFAHKGITVEKAKKAIQLAKDAGISTRAFLMFGFYEDGEDSAKDMLRFLDDVQPDAARLSLLVPMPGTEVWQRAEEFGIQLPASVEDYQYAGLDGPQTFIRTTKYLNEKQFLDTIKWLQKGFVNWALNKNSGRVNITNIQALNK